MGHSDSSARSRRSPFVVLADWIIGHRLLTVILLVAMTCVAGIGHYDPYLILSDHVAPTDGAPANDKEGKRRRAKPPTNNISPIRVAAGDVIVVAQSDEFFTREGADAIRDAVAAIEALPHVDNIFWMDEAPMLNIFGLPEPILPRGSATQTRFDAARKRAIEHPLGRRTASLGRRINDVANGHHELVARSTG